MSGKMRKYNNKLKDSGYLAYRIVSPVFDPIKSLSNLVSYPKYVRDIFAYSKMKGSEKIQIANVYPVLEDNSKTTPFDSHYFYQDIWASRKIYVSKAKKHIDVGSKVDFVGFLTTFSKVVFVDIRPLGVNLKNFESIKGDVTNLPFKTSSQKSVSCLHVAEHIGLGRYGDPLDPRGTKKACGELARVLAKGGRLYFSLPVGKPRLCFNAHRIHPPDQILDYFPDLKLKELSGVTDGGEYIENININTLRKSNYACGLFEFTKE